LIERKINMAKDWQELTKISRGAPVVVERVRLVENDIALEGSFELPPMARLTMEDQIFVTAFVRSHGSIKEMEELFGISYPTVKNRLNTISQQLEFVEINPPLPQSEILDKLDKGELSVEDALQKLRGEE
jgi:hypothetical protein